MGHRMLKTSKLSCYAQRCEQLPAVSYSKLLGDSLSAYYRAPDHPAKLRILRWIESALGPKRIVRKTDYGFLMALDKADMIQGSLFWSGRWETELSEFLTRQLRRGDTFYDIGANVGYFSCLAARCGAADIVAIEPDPLTMSILRLNWSLNGFPSARVHLLERALADEAGRRAFYRSHLTNTGRSGLTNRDSVASFEVEIGTLDTLVAEKQAPPPNVIKIDAEGFDEAVLRGGLATIERHHPRLIIFESEVAHDGLPPPPLSGLLTSRGYKIQRIEEQQASEWLNFAAIHGKAGL